jgi:hypothetical protein
MDRLYQTSVTTPPGTTPAAPQSTPFPLEDANLETVTILIPDGHAGLTGIRVMMANQEIIPWSNSDWLVSNNEVITVTVNSQVTITGLVIETYNLDAFSHSHWVRAAITDLNTNPGTLTASPAVIPAADLSTL